MSETEILSIHPGPVNLTLKDHTQVKIELKPTGDMTGGKAVFVAKVDEKVAAVLLDGIGKPHYWRPGAIVIDSAPLQVRGAPNPAVGELAGITNFQKFVAAVKACDNLSVLQIMSGEDGIGSKKREVINARIAELTPTGLTKENYETMTIEELAIAINECTDTDLLMELAAAETQGENREDRFDLLTTRLEALKQ